uniref:General transcription factor IIH subunit 4 n=1 Tax=Meloidogyne javanica TaxID=6303 RepID=A0A915N5S6_MELJA
MMTDSIFNDRPFLEFLATQGEDLIQQLYESQHCVIAIMRMLPFDVQQCLIQLMFIKSKDWFSGNEKMWKQAINSLQLLKKLGILEGDLEHENLRLNLDFRMNYIASLLTSLNKLSGLSSHPLDDKSQKSANKDLLGKSISRWESILCYLALPNETPDKSVSETTRSLFHFIGLIKGSLFFRFYFLIKEPPEYCFDAIRLTICIQPNEAKISPQVLDQTWPENIQAFLMTLREIGLIFIRKRKDGWFLLTPLLVEITREIGNGGEIVENSLENKGGGGQNKNGFLIVETNYRIYAYTNSTLQLAIISTFAEIIYRFPNVSIGLLSRDSIRRALQQVLIDSEWDGRVKDWWTEYRKTL